MNLPNSIKTRSKIDPKLAVGSSLAKPKELIALTILLYIINEEKDYLEYTVQSGNTIQLKEDLIDLIKNFLSSINEFNEQEINSLKQENSLISMQLEPLQVSLQIVWKLAKVSAINSNSSSQERTGGVRVPKSLSFTSNLILLKSILSDDNNIITECSKSLLYSWIFDKPIKPEQQNIENKLKSTLIIFTEDTLYKTWLDNNTEIIFQQESIYDLINNKKDIVNLKGAKEIKGTLRNLKSLFAHNLHPYLKINDNNVSLREQALLDNFNKYKAKVSNQLDLNPKAIETIEINQENELLSSSINLETTPHQVIFYGSPGTGKSRKIDLKIHGHKTTRITFHPETDYYSFVGSYKPVMNGTNIAYKFVPQAFIKAYCDAWKNPDKPHYLIIEEINRGNCAQIFGDIFQSLDRDETGKSKYEVDCNEDLANYLKEVFAKTDIVNNRIILPRNLYIFATMNTSDQSLFPMDSAFKRRWDWEFIPVNYEDAYTLSISIENDMYNWGNFIKNINPKIKELTGSEDKQLGNRFVSPNDGIITFEQFRSKVLFYLWSEVYKDEYGSQNSIFKYKNEENDIIDFQFEELYTDKSTEIIKSFLKFNEIKPENDNSF